MRNYRLYNESAEPAIINGQDTLFRAIFDDSPDAIFLIDPTDFSITDCNTKALQLFQAQEKNELNGLDTFSLYESEPVEFSRNLFMETVRKGMEHTQEQSFRSLKGNIFWGRSTIRPVTTGNGTIIVFRVRRVVDYMKTAEMMAAMIKHTSKATGYEYFSSVDELLSNTFSVSTTFIAKIDLKLRTATTVHCRHKSLTIENFSFGLDQSPSLNVMRGYPTFYPRNLREMFPEDPLIRKHNIEGFMGTPVFDAKGEVCGLLILMDDKVMEEIPNSRYILSMFASRAGAEFERIQVEEQYQNRIRELENRKI